MGIEDDFYSTIKFKSGEEIFAKINYDQDHDRCFLILDNPITIERIKTRSTSGYKVEPWIKTSKEELFVINMDDVMMVDWTPVAAIRPKGDVELLYEKFKNDHLHRFQL